MDVTEIFEGVYKIDGKLATKSIAPGIRVYDEELKKIREIEYRLWNPYRSKLAAAIINGLSELNIKHNSSVLYLGAATGTTPSHVSDIVEKRGSVYCVEISKRSMRDLLNVCERRENMFPIFEDARKYENYSSDIGIVDVIYEDVAAPDQAKILLANSSMLMENGSAYVAIKSQSIDVSKDPKLVFEQFIEEISGKFKVAQRIKIEPFDKMHLFLHLKKL